MQQPVRHTAPRGNGACMASTVPLISSCRSSLAPRAILHLLAICRPASASVATSRFQILRICMGMHCDLLHSPIQHSDPIRMYSLSLLQTRCPKVNASTLSVFQTENHWEADRQARIDKGLGGMADDPVDEKDEKIKVSCTGWCHLLSTAEQVCCPGPLQCPAA